MVGFADSHIMTTRDIYQLNKKGTKPDFRMIKFSDFQTLNQAYQPNQEHPTILTKLNPALNPQQILKYFHQPKFYLNSKKNPKNAAKPHVNLNFLLFLHIIIYHTSRKIDIFTSEINKNFK